MNYKQLFNTWEEVLRLLSYEFQVSYEAFTVWVFLFIIPSIITVQFFIIIYMRRTLKGLRLQNQNTKKSG